MHPILGHPERLVLYFSAWLAFGVLLAAVLGFGAHAAPPWALALALPMALVLGTQALSTWYLVRMLPAVSVPPGRLLTTWAAAGAIYLAVWLGLALAWAAGLSVLAAGWQPAQERELTPLLLFAGSIGLLVAILAHYMAAAFEQAREAEHRTLESRIQAREAEMSFLRAQLDPHFLFNSLNSVAALTGTDPAAARRMCFLLADFFRRSLTLGAQQSIALAEELKLVESFLAIEQVRFGERLQQRFEVEEEALAAPIPALLLQPLVENAVHHGIAQLLAGGEIRLGARRRGGALELTVENPCDPELPASHGTGVGLANVRRRLGNRFGARAGLTVEALPDRFRVQLLLPDIPPGD
jgi:two-component system, LytTR family, sensor histidine kinase AlgZ